jgi:hypothetical protein
MKTSFYSITALSALIASVQGCKGNLKELDIIIPKDAKSANTTSIYVKWQRPWPVQEGKHGPYSCDIAPGYDTAFVYGSLNTTYEGDSFIAQPMNYFDNFVWWTPNSTSEDADGGKQKWHVSSFAASISTGKVTSLVLDVLVEGAV